MKPELLCDRCGHDHAANPQAAGVFWYSYDAEHERLDDIKVLCLGKCNQTRPMPKGEVGWHHGDELSGGRAMAQLMLLLDRFHVAPRTAAQKKLFDVFLALAQLPTFKSVLEPNLPLTHGRPRPRVRRQRPAAAAPQDTAQRATAAPKGTTKH